MGIAALGKMVEQVDRDNKKEDKAANEVVDDVLASIFKDYKNVIHLHSHRKINYCQWTCAV